MLPQASGLARWQQILLRPPAVVAGTYTWEPDNDARVADAWAEVRVAQYVNPPLAMIQIPSGAAQQVTELYRTPSRRIGATPALHPIEYGHAWSAYYMPRT